MCLALQLICNSCGEYCAPFIDSRVICADEDSYETANIEDLAFCCINNRDIDLSTRQLRGFLCPFIEYEKRRTNLDDEDEMDWQCWACRYHSFFMYHEDNPMNHKTFDPEGKLPDWVYLVRNDKVKLCEVVDKLFADARDHANRQSTLLDPYNNRPDDNRPHRISMMKMLMNFYWIGDMPAVL